MWVWVLPERNTEGSVLRRPADRADRARVSKRGRGAAEFGIWNLLWRSFKYSPRPGTPASMIEDQVPENVKSERLIVLQDLLRSQQLEFNKQLIGKDIDVMFDKEGKYNRQIIGKSPYLQSVIVETDDNIIGKIKKVHITKAGLNSLTGEIKG